MTEPPADEIVERRLRALLDDGKDLAIINVPDATPVEEIVAAAQRFAASQELEVTIESAHDVVYVAKRAPR